MSISHILCREESIMNKKNDDGNTAVATVAAVGSIVLCLACKLNMVLTVIISMVVSMVAYFATIPMETKKLEAQKQKGNWPKFYQECAEYGINGLEDLRQPDKRQRAERLLQSKGLPFKTVEEVFAPDHPEFQRIRQAEQQEKNQEIERQRDFFTKLAQEKLYLSKLHGLDKPLHIFQEQLRALNNDTSAPSYIPMKKESDGMIMAGLASGIGGVVPALASLNSTAQHNEAIRAQNQVAQSINQTLLLAKGDTYKYRRRLERYIEEYSKKLTEDINPKLLLYQLKIETKNVKVKDCSVILVEADVLVRKEIQIFEKYPAVIDGWINAKVFENGKLVGECPMPFPARGACPDANSKVQTVLITGILLSEGKPDATYRVEYDLGDLWAMEK